MQYHSSLITPASYVFQMQWGSMPDLRTKTKTFPGFLSNTLLGENFLKRNHLSRCTDRGVFYVPRQHPQFRIGTTHLAPWSHLVSGQEMRKGCVRKRLGSFLGGVQSPPSVVPRVSQKKSPQFSPGHQPGIQHFFQIALKFFDTCKTYPIEAISIRLDTVSVGA